MRHTHVCVCLCVCVWMGRHVQQKTSSTQKCLKKRRKVVLQRGVHTYGACEGCTDTKSRFSRSCDDVTSLPRRYQKDGILVVSHSSHLLSL